MNTVTASFNTTVRQMTENVSPKCFTKMFHQKTQAGVRVTGSTFFACNIERFYSFHWKPVKCCSDLMCRTHGGVREVPPRREASDYSAKHMRPRDGRVCVGGCARSCAAFGFGIMVEINMCQQLWTVLCCGLSWLWVVRSVRGAKCFLQVNRKRLKPSVSGIQGHWKKWNKTMKWSKFAFEWFAKLIAHDDGFSGKTLKCARGVGWRQNT